MDADWPRALLYALAVVVVGAFVVAASTSTAAFGAYNPAWDGVSDLRTEAGAVGTDATLVRNVSAYGETNATGAVAVVFSPDQPYTAADAARIREFVEAGGTLVVAEDFGANGNDLLARVGAEARFDGRLLRDERRNFRSPSLPVATNVSNHTLVANVSSLTLNYGTSVRPNGGDILVSSSEYGYLDSNRNGSLEANESMGTYPVATVEAVGEGRVVAVGDPSLFINAMLDRTGNQAFVRALFESHQQVLLDYSHATKLPPLAVAVLVLRESAILQVLFGTAVVGAIAAWSNRRLSLATLRRALGRLRGGPDRAVERQRPASEAAMADYLAERHPEWEHDRIHRLVRQTQETDEDTRQREDTRL